MGEHENCRRAVVDRLRAVEVRKTGWKLRRELSAGRWANAFVEVVRVRRGVDGATGRWRTVLKARRARGEINWGILGGLRS